MTVALHQRSSMALCHWSGTIGAIESGSWWKGGQGQRIRLRLSGWSPHGSLSLTVENGGSRVLLEALPTSISVAQEATSLCSSFNGPDVVPRRSIETGITTSRSCRRRLRRLSLDDGPALKYHGDSSHLPSPISHIQPLCSSSDPSASAASLGRM